MLLSFLNNKSSFLPSTKIDGTSYVNSSSDFNTGFSFFDLATNFFNKYLFNYYLSNNIDSTSGTLIYDQISDNFEIIEDENELIKQTIFRVQLGAFKNPLSQQNFDGIEQLISFIGEDGLIRYVAGSFNNYEEASKYQIKMRSQGFIDCYVIEDYNGNIYESVLSDSVFDIDDILLDTNELDKKNIVEDFTVEQIEKESVAQDFEEQKINENHEKLVFKEDYEEAIFQQDANENIAMLDDDKSLQVDVSRKINTKSIEDSFEEDPLPSDIDIIKQHPNIKETAKDLILEAIEEGDVAIADVFDLLNEYAGETINKRKVKRFIKKNSR